LAAQIGAASSVVSVAAFGTIAKPAFSDGAQGRQRQRRTPAQTWAEYRAEKESAAPKAERSE
jgi:hypothetical protein